MHREQRKLDTREKKDNGSGAYRRWTNTNNAQTHAIRLSSAYEFDFMKTLDATDQRKKRKTNYLHIINWFHAEYMRDRALSARIIDVGAAVR